MDKDINDIAFSRDTVTMRLAQIQKRCTQLLETPDSLELSLEEPADIPDPTNPYNRG